MQIKIFYEDTATDLENEINDWLEEMEEDYGEDFKIKSILQSEIRTSWTISVLYETE